MGYWKSTEDCVAMYDAFDDHRGHMVVLNKYNGLRDGDAPVSLFCEACEELVLFVDAPTDGNGYHFPIDKATGELLKISEHVYEVGTPLDEINKAEAGAATGATTSPVRPPSPGHGVHPVGSEVAILSPHVRPKYLNGVYGKVTAAPPSPSGLYDIEVDPELLKADPRIAGRASGGLIRVRGGALRRLV